MNKISIFLISFLLFANAATAKIDAPEEGWSVVKSRHFLVYYKDVPIDFVHAVKSAAETNFKEIFDNLGLGIGAGWDIDERAKIYIFPSQEEYIASGKTYKWSNGMALVQEKIIRTFPLDHGFFDSVLPHELGHIIFRKFVGFEVELPLWFEEGVAMYQEKAKRWGANKFVKDAMKNKKFMDLKELTNTRFSKTTKQEAVDLFYAESASVINFLINEYGEERFYRFCKDLNEGFTFAASFEKAYPQLRTMERFNKRWIEYIEKL
ncbi:MAG: hypothetical protein HQL25_06120 [Candidatus Omnitrophica bacterium]|nr:hypothetical protein [Candidatus Omnitrophota bacterium]